MRHNEIPDVPAARRRTVCVIGAGVSGLRAAGLLAKAGLSVTVLEARDRVGGRVQQSHQLGPPIDIGASWIHGTQRNPLVGLAEQAGATTVACGAVDSICDADGGWLGSDLARRYYEEVWAVLGMAVEESREGAAARGRDAGMMEFFRREVAARRGEAEQPEVYEALMLRIVEMWGAFMGDECENQSLRNLWLDAGLDGDNLFVASTFEPIVAELLLPVASKAAIRLGCEVTRIAGGHTDAVHIEASDGYRGTFDDVIVTAPLGWLKRNEDVFSPGLPPAMSTAIHSLGYGNLDKVFVKFPRAYWDARAPGSNGDCGHGPEGAAKLPFPIESLFLRPNYAVDTNPAGWRQEIISLSGLPPPFSQPVIMFFVYGQWGRHVTGLVRGMGRDSPEYHRILDRIFQPYYSKLPSYDAASPDCRPSGFLATDWQGDRLAGYGSFTNLPVGAGDGARHLEVLREGMGEDRGIWFAGEHTSPLGGLGTVTGAYWSGTEVAKRVARRCGVTIEA